MSSDASGSSDGNGSSDSGSGGDGSSGQRENGGGGRGGSNGPSAVEKAVTVVSALFTVLLFAFLVWQAFQVPTSTTPEVSIEATEQLSGDRVAVTVRLTNPANEGLQSATVAVDCGQPPPSIEFAHLPTDSRVRGVLVCPAGTAGNATANVTAWRTA